VTYVLAFCNVEKRRLPTRHNATNKNIITIQSLIRIRINHKETIDRGMSSVSATDEQRCLSSPNGLGSTVGGFVRRPARMKSRPVFGAIFKQTRDASVAAEITIKGGGGGKVAYAVLSWSPSLELEVPDSSSGWLAGWSDRTSPLVSVLSPALVA
jgi:hypothetical protein